MKISMPIILFLMAVRSIGRLASNKKRLHNFNTNGHFRDSASCIEYDDINVVLDPDKNITKGKYLCNKYWTFGIQGSKDELQLLHWGNLVWTAGIDGIEFCFLDAAGIFSCYDKTPGFCNVTGCYIAGIAINAIYTICSGITGGARLHLDSRWWYEIRLDNQSATLWSVSRMGNEKISCDK